MTDHREFDIVLWGATGFTGSLVAEYLAGVAEAEGLSWALAGRNEEKLKAVRSSLGGSFAELPLLTGDSLDEESLRTIASRTRVVLTTVGPYARYGTPLVQACIAEGTDYCDLTGEPQWVRANIDAFHDAAAEAGVRIVHCAGFDSIPSDLGTLFLQQEAKKRFGAHCEQVQYILWNASGGFSGGTVASMAELMDQAGKDPEIRAILNDPYALNPPGEREGPDGAIQMGLRHEPLIEAWTAPFVMAAVNEKVVRRTNAIQDYPYGRDFRYSESSHGGKGLPGVFRASLLSVGLGAFAGAMALKPTRRLLNRFVLPSPGDGPSKEAIEKGRFRVRLIGRGTDQDGHAFELQAQVGASRDPGYGATALMISETAISLAHDQPEGTLPGGILTPASALGDVLTHRLRRAGMTFELLS